MERDSFQFIAGKNIYMLRSIWAALSPRLTGGNPGTARTELATKKQRDNGKQEATYDVSERR